MMKKIISRKFQLTIPFILATGLLVVTLATFFQSSHNTVHAATAASPLDVVISEIAWMGTAVSANDEWIELYNNTGSPIDLAGWTLNAADGTPSIALAGTIPANSYFLLERTDDSTVPGVTADMLYTGALNNDGEDLVLRDNGSIVVDRVDGNAGWLSGHADGRVPMVRLDTTLDGSQADNWNYNPRCGSATNAVGVSHTCTLTTTAVGQSLNYSVFFNERATTAITITTEITEIERELLSLIDQATTSIDVALYGLNRQSVVDALIAAHVRGVTLRVVGDDEAATHDYDVWYQTLVDAGITIITDTSASKIQHNKFLIVDDEIVWSGSTNFTDTGLTLNTNNGIIITDTALAGIYQTEFEEMWNGDFQGDKTDRAAHLLDYNGTLVESYFSPTDLVAFEVWDELAGADETIHFAMFFWTDDLLANRVVERLGDGVDVFGVWDQLGASNVSSDDETLCAAGAQIKIENFPGKVHHKFAVIDAFGSDPIVVLGSYNWTDSGAYSNDENTLIIHDAALAQAYYEEWQRLWEAIDLDRLCNPNQLYLPTMLTPLNEELLHINGYVREEEAGGPGAAGVDIYRAIASYPGQLVATTDADGYYEATPFDSQGHQETIRLWAEKGGYTFEPIQYAWIYYGFGSAVTKHFTATSTIPNPANVQITSILYNPDGDDVQGEYVAIENVGGTAETMTNWTLTDNASHTFTFPPFELQPGASVRVWTKAGVDTGTDLFWGSSGAVWNNSGDSAFLRDDFGVSVDTCTYTGGGMSASCDD